MPTEGLVGTDIVSLLKTVTDACDYALEDFAKEQENHDPANFAHAAECFEAIEEFLGGYKLPLIITTLKRIALRTEKA